jgi:hypothetical protein
MLMVGAGELELDVGRDWDGEGRRRRGEEGRQDVNTRKRVAGV